MKLDFFDTDWYKLTMGEAIFKNYRDIEVEYELFLRDGNRLDEVQLASKIDHINDLLYRLARCEPNQAILSSLNLDKDYKNWLAKQKLKTDAVKVRTRANYYWEKDPRYNWFGVSFYGNWIEMVLLETHILSILSEVFHEDDEIKQQDIDNLHRKVELAQEHGFKIVDFGTRRRFNQAWHEEIVLNQARSILISTSNVRLAYKLGFSPSGTLAHEWFMAHQAFVHPKQSQKVALNKWIYSGVSRPFICPTDTLTTDAFLSQFTLEDALYWDGLRQDSGDPFYWADKIIDFYKKNWIDLKTKTFVFSDNLTFELMARLWDKYHDITNVVFGIGTNLTCDILGVRPLNAVIKMTKCNGEPVAKLSDDPAKGTFSDSFYASYLNDVAQRMAYNKRI